MDSLQALWDAICELVRPLFSSIAFSSWISCIVPVALDQNKLHLSVRSSFQKKIIAENYISHIAKAFEQIMGFPAEIVLTAEDETISATIEPSLDIPTAISQFSFSNFITAPSNNFAYAASVAVSKNPGKTYNPLFIYGDSGLGKTHLLSAIFNAVRVSFPSYKVVSVQGEEFVNEFVEAIQKNKQQDFRNKYRNSDMLILDDVQFIANKPGTQDEFFHTFEALHRTGHQIVLSSDRPPKDILSLDSRLRSRFETGLADISPPDYETRVAIIKKKSEILGLVLPDDVIFYISDKLKSNVRQIQAVLQMINAKYLINGVPPSIAVAVESCRDIINEVKKPDITVEMIVDELSKTYQLQPASFYSNSHNSDISFARQIAMYIAREITTMSLKEIGDAFGGRNYSTVHYSIEKTKKEIKNNKSLSNSVEDMINNLKNKGV